MNINKKKISRPDIEAMNLPRAVRRSPVLLLLSTSAIPNFIKNLLKRVFKANTTIAIMIKNMISLKKPSSVIFSAKPSSAIFSAEYIGKVEIKNNRLVVLIIWLCFI